MALFAEPKVRAHRLTAGLTRLDVNLGLAQDTQAEWPLWLQGAEGREPGPGCAVRAGALQGGSWGRPGCSAWPPFLSSPQGGGTGPILVTGQRPSSRLNRELAALPRCHPAPRRGYPGAQEPRSVPFSPSLGHQKSQEPRHHCPLPPPPHPLASLLFT